MAKLKKAELARRTVTETLITIYEGDFYRLDDIVAQHGTGLSIQFEAGYYDDPGVVQILRIREETDEEYNNRINELKRVQNEAATQKREAAKMRELAERETYERLKKKFEK